MSTQRDYSLLDFPRRRGIQNVVVPGNYRTTMLRSQFLSLVAGDLTEQTFDPAIINAIPVLLFKNDYPIICSANSRYDGVRLTTDDATTFVTLPIYQHDEDVFHLGRVNAAAWPAFFTPDVAGVDIGNDVGGETVTNTVRVTGFPLEVKIVPQGLVDAVGAIKPRLIFDAWSSSSVEDGIPMYNGVGTAPLGPGGANFPSQRAILLNEVDYTEAIRDGTAAPAVVGRPNTIVDGTGLIGNVVGIFSVPV